jgi:hypothetical protein
MDDQWRQRRRRHTEAGRVRMDSIVLLELEDKKSKIPFLELWKNDALA